MFSDVVRDPGDVVDLIGQSNIHEEYTKSPELFVNSSSV